MPATMFFTSIRCMQVLKTPMADAVRTGIRTPSKVKIRLRLRMAKAKSLKYPRKTPVAASPVTKDGDSRRSDAVTVKEMEKRM